MHGDVSIKGNDHDYLFKLVSKVVHKTSDMNESCIYVQAVILIYNTRLLYCCSYTFDFMIYVLLEFS